MTSRRDVEFKSGGDVCRAWLYLPRADAPRPVVVMAHGLGGLRTMRLDAFAERFCAAGYACLVFDYRGFGDSGGAPRQLLDIGRQLEDWRAAIAWARQCPDVDAARVAIWGTSFGGGHVLSIAAEDPRIAAVIAQCPFTDGFASALALSPISSMKVTAYALADRLGALLGRAPILLPNAGRAHEAAFMTAHDALDGILNLHPPGTQAEPTPVAARFGLDIIRYFPGRKVPKILCPVLFCVCDKDTVAPAAATLRHAARARRGEVLRYAEGHFDIYIGAAFERVVADQIDFLQRQLPLR